MASLEITEVARRSGLAASALRFYEEKGLIGAIGRRRGRRLYDEGVLERLALIALGRAAGFTLEEVKRTFGADGRVSIDRTMLKAKADELERTVRRLKALQRGLRHAAACPARQHMDCPTFRRMLRAAAKGQVVATRRASELEGRKPSARPSK